MKRSLPFIILFALGIMWGCSIPLAKTAVSTGHSPFGLLFWQFTISSAVLSIIALWRRSRIILDKRHGGFFLVICLLGTLVPNGFSYTAAYHLPGGVMALVIAMVPVFSLLIALVLGLEQFHWRRMSGVVLGIVAISLIVLPESSLPEPGKALFVLIALIAPFCYGLEGSYLALRQPADTGPIGALLGASVVGMLITLPLTLSTGTFVNPMTSFGIPEAAIIATALLHVAAYTGYIWMVEKSGPVFAAQVGYIVTPAGVLISMVALNESPSSYIWIALVLLLVAIALVQPNEKPKLQSPASV